MRADLISAEARALLLAVARVVLLGRRGTLAEQLDRIQTPRGRAGAPPGATPISGRHRAGRGRGAKRPRSSSSTASAASRQNGREYVTVLGPGQSTPAPWINVIANPGFGFQVSAEGSGYTWSVNSRENQLTPWSNDPVSDRPGEAIYVRDEETGELWGRRRCRSATTARYIARHGQGYSRFEHDGARHRARAAAIRAARRSDQDLAAHDPQRLRPAPRRLSVTAYVEWVLGLSRGASAPTVVTEIDAETGAIFARNPWNIHHGTRVAFADLGGRQTGWTGDRREFIGRNGTPTIPRR